jgi:CRP/FNR family transcriptional regulator
MPHKLDLNTILERKNNMDLSISTAAFEGTGDFAYEAIKSNNANCQRAQCGQCKQRHLCLSVGKACQQADSLDALVSTRLHIRRGETLYLAGDAFKAFYAIHGGFFKTYMLSEDGREQVVGFHMAGEMMGLDGIESDQHGLTAVALEDSHVCVMPYASIAAACAHSPDMQRTLMRLMSGEIARSQGVSLLLGSMSAEKRVSAFLQDLSQRLAKRGYSATEFYLRMTREEIGSYLGLKLETVSRIFSKFQALGWLAVRNKHICLTNAEALFADEEKSTGGIYAGRAANSRRSVMMSAA